MPIPDPVARPRSQTASRSSTTSSGSELPSLYRPCHVDTLPVDCKSRSPSSLARSLSDGFSASRGLSSSGPPLRVRLETAAMACQRGPDAFPQRSCSARGSARAQPRCRDLAPEIMWGRAPLCSRRSPRPRFRAVRQPASVPSSPHSRPAPRPPPSLAAAHASSLSRRLAESGSRQTRLAPRPRPPEPVHRRPALSSPRSRTRAAQPHASTSSPRDGRRWHRVAPGKARKERRAGVRPLSGGQAQVRRGSTLQRVPQRRQRCVSRSFASSTSSRRPGSASERFSR